MREYIIALQGNLLQKQGSYPPPPPHVNLQSSRANIPDGSVSRPVEARSEGLDDPNRAAPTASMRTVEDELQASARASVGEQRDDNAMRIDSKMGKRPRMPEELPANGPPHRSP